MLYTANPGPEYKSYILNHAVKIYNMISHIIAKLTPHFSFTRTKPNIEFYFFLAAAYFSECHYKLADHTSEAIFLGYTATNKNYIL
jgi:hypothetical protein